MTAVTKQSYWGAGMPIYLRDTAAIAASISVVISAPMQLMEKGPCCSDLARVNRCNGAGARHQRRGRKAILLIATPDRLARSVAFVVTNLSRLAERLVAFYNQRGKAKQYIKEGKNAIKWTPHVHTRIAISTPDHGSW